MQLTVAKNFWARFPERYTYLQQSCELTASMLDFTGLEVSWLIAAETQGIDAAGREQMQKFCLDYGYQLIWHDGPADLGANMNFLFDNIQTDVFLYIQDDYAPTMDIPDILSDVQYLQQHENLGIIRYPYFDGFVDNPAFVRVNDRYVNIPKGAMTYRYSDNPHLQHKRWREKAGRYKEFIGQTMSEVAMDEQARHTPLDIYCRDLPRGFSHTGTVSTVPEKWEQMKK